MKSCNCECRDCRNIHDGDLCDCDNGCECIEYGDEE
jgi:hypothetical protein